MSLTLDGTPRIEVARCFDPSDDVFGGPQGPERVPESMLLELMAMTGGQLIFQRLDRRRLPLLLKVPECRVEGEASAGDRLRAVATLRGLTSQADETCVAETETEVSVESTTIVRARLMFVCVDAPEDELARGARA